jgi:hypothetical protein
VIRIRVRGPNFEPLIEMLANMAHPDLRPLAERVAPLMVEDNRRGMLAGTDADGSTAVPPRESTIARGRGGDGPVRVPRSEGSRFVADYRVEHQSAPDRELLIGGWRSTPFVRFFATGTRHMVARDPIGIRPEGMERIAAEVHDFAATLIGGRP